jgi:ABC-type bacteriocin/lantibiotic exporter with double-glycine peptidase domain
MISIANIGQTDKIIRLVAGVVLVAVSFMLLGGINTPLGIISLVIAVVLIVTGLFNFCPAYKIFNLSSLKKSK